MENNNRIDIQLLEELIIGRVEPHIYAFTTGTVPNYLKVGDTYRPVEKRLNEWRKYFPELEKKFKEIAKVDDETFFRDFAVHRYLENEIQKSRLLPDSLESIPYYSNEFFKEATSEDLDNAIVDIKESHKNNNPKYQFYKFEDSRIPIIHTYNRTENYEPRPNQKETIGRFKEALKKGRNNLLMYAVMRFGKSFTSMCCAIEMNAKIVLIVSAKADVKEEWKKTVESHKKFDGFSFLDSNSLLESETVIKDKLEANEKVALFLTLQDLQGDDIKTKHKEVFEKQIDLLLIDETHFGARAQEYGKVLKDFKAGEKRSELKEYDESLDELDETTKIINSKVRIHLSGTPYRILMNSEFEEDDIIAFYQFTNIAEDQEEWDKQNLNKDEVKEWDNPYYGFPQMIRFAFNPNKSSRKKMEELKKLGVTYAFSELLKPKSILKDNTNQLHKKFIYEQEIIDLLNVIDGTDADDNLLSFLDYDKLKEGKMCRHIVCVLPYRASCDAFEELIKSNEFKNLNSYEVINISGVENDNIYKDTQSVKSKISECESENKKTITLTVNRMLTGSTVPEWDTMLYLKDTASPQEYDQAIFRLQSQYIKVLKEPEGDTVKYNMKPQTLLVDFNPNRMFQMQEQKSQIYNVNVESNGNTKLEERIKRELQISPIVVINNNKMVEVEPTDILDAVRQYSSERSVLDEATSISIDYSLLDIEAIKDVIEKQGGIKSRQGLEIEPSEGEGDDIDTGNGEKPEEGDKASKSSKDDDKIDYKGKFAMYYARILFFSFLTDSTVKSLQEIINAIIDDNNNLRIAIHLNLEIDILRLFQEHINGFVLSELDYKIQNINSLANDSTISPIERARNAMKKFGRLSDAEIVTPEIVTDKMIGSLPADVISENTLLLDIASKQGEFVYATYKKFGKNVANNFYSIPTSKIAYEFTRKVYKLLELDIEKVESNYTSYDLIEVNEIIQMEGYSYDRYVVYDIVKNDWGLHYKLVNLRTKDYQTADIIRPLKEKFGIGYYYDSENPQYMDSFEVAILLQEAQQKKKAEQEEAEKEKVRVEEVKKIGRLRMIAIFPENAQAVIVARLKQNESDSQTDYYASSVQRTVILGFSTHKRDIFSEMRKHAPNFEGTAYLAEFNEDYEHREKYSMGDGYYLGESKYSGWIIEKTPIYKRENTIEEFAYTAGNEDNIHISKPNSTPPSNPTGAGKNGCTLVEYSTKAVAVFGDTKSIKDELRAMGGRFNARLTFNGKKLAGWIFSKSQEQQLACYFGLD